MQRSSVLDFDKSGMLRHAADRYKTMLEAILEMFQNAVDSGATEIWISVNTKTRRLTFSDNGEGASVQKFELALRSVGRTIKTSDQMGQFGLGMVVAYGKCRYHLFISTPKENPKSYNEWRFSAEEIEGMKEEIRIPLTSRPDLNYSTKPDSGVPWRTRIEMVDYMKDSVRGRIEMAPLVEAIQGRFNRAMLENNTVAHITIKSGDTKETVDLEPLKYEGKKMDVYRVTTEDHLRCTFTLYLAKRGKKGRQGRVVLAVEGDKFQLPFNVFLDNLQPGFGISEEAKRALLSGVFEGEIVSNKIKLESHRKGYEESDSLVDFCIAIDKWFEEVGHKEFKEIQDHERSTKYQALGVSTLKFFDQFLSTPAGSWIKHFIGTFKKGTIGQGHLEKGSPNSLTERPAISAREGEKKEFGHGDTRPRDIPQTEHKKHTPQIVFGPEGKKRRIVRSDSQGIGIDHDILKKTELWEFDRGLGVITFNIQHPLWILCEDKGPRALNRFQRWLFLEALFVESCDEEFRILARTGAHQKAAANAHDICYGDGFVERGVKPLKDSEKLRRI